jgi:hypothetical protein
MVLVDHATEHFVALYWRVERHDGAFVVLG